MAKKIKIILNLIYQVMKKRRRKRKNFIEKIALPVNDDAKQPKKT